MVFQIRARGFTCNEELQFVSGIKFVFLCMQQRLKRYAAEIEKAEEYVELVDQFYQENRKLVTINQATASEAGRARGRGRASRASGRARGLHSPAGACLRLESRARRERP